jgi:putative hydrolase of the HAD superfamily
MIRALVFDVDGVLVHPWRFRDLLASQHAISPEMTAPFFKGPFRDCVLGRAELHSVLPPFLETWGWDGSLERFVETWLTVENAPDLAVLEQFDELRAQGLRCFAASVQERVRGRYLTRDMGFGARFDGLFFSYELGLVKPQVEFFREVASRIAEPPGSLLFFDDAQRNVEAARLAGWRAEPYVDAAKLRSDLERHLGPGIARSTGS